MRKLYKSLILAMIPFVVAFGTYLTFPALWGQEVPSLLETGGYTLYHATIDAVAIFIVANVIFEA